MYLLGGVHGEDRAAVEDHLVHCAWCLREADLLGPAVEALAALDPEDAARLLAGRDVASDAPPARPRRSERRRPDPWVPRYRHRMLLAVAAIGLVVVLTTGTALGIALGRGGDAGGTGRAGAAVAVATTDRTAGATLSVIVTSTQTRTATVHATVTGLHDGERYQLIAVTVDGVPIPVTDWRGTAGTRDLTEDIPAAASTLAFFAVARADGTSVVSAYLPQPAHSWPYPHGSYSPSGGGPTTMDHRARGASPTTTATHPWGHGSRAGPARKMTRAVPVADRSPSAKAPTGA
ncbi:MAG TPA: hypothetical protein VJT31_02690 [Rugosimonospora sp.]|nr:hypothetical protein [Rugosimonospora sp.]